MWNNHEKSFNIFNIIRNSKKKVIESNLSNTFNKKKTNIACGCRIIQPPKWLYILYAYIYIIALYNVQRKANCCMKLTSSNLKIQSIITNRNLIRVQIIPCRFKYKIVIHSFFAAPNKIRRMKIQTDLFVILVSFIYFSSFFYFVTALR